MSKKRDIQSLAEMGNVTELAAYLEEKSQTVRVQAIKGLESIGDEAAMTHVRSAVSSDDAHVVAAAIDALSVRSTSAEAARGLVLDLAASPDQMVRTAVARFVSRHPHALSTSVAAQMANDSSPSVRNLAFGALAMNETRVTTESLLGLLAGRASNTVVDIECGLFRSFCLPSAMKIYDPRPYSLSAAAARALAGRTEPEVVSQLIPVVEDVPEKLTDTWSEAAWALGFQSATEGTKALLRALELPRPYKKHVAKAQAALAASTDPEARGVTEDLVLPRNPMKAYGRTVSVLGRGELRESAEAIVGESPTDFVMRDEGRTLVATADKLIFIREGGRIRREVTLITPFDQIGAVTFTLRRNGHFFIWMNNPEFNMYATSESKLTRPYAQWLTNRLNNLGLRPSIQAR